MKKIKPKPIDLIQFLKRTWSSFYEKTYCFYVTTFPYSFEEDGFQLLSVDLMQQVYRKVSDGLKRHRILQQIMKKASATESKFDYFHYVCRKEETSYELKKSALEKMVETAKTRNDWLKVKEMAKQTHNCYHIESMADEKIPHTELQEMRMSPST